MKHGKYHIEASTSLLKFEFFSEGPKGKVRKQIVYKPLEANPNVFNLGFGDVDDEGVINDSIITNNNDSKKVLATVALTVYKFYEKYADSYVFITGSTKTRTRLYRIGITNNLKKIVRDFQLFGFIDESWESFATGREYEAFLIKKKL